MKMLNKILMLYAFPSFLFFIFTSPGVKDLESKKGQSLHKQKFLISHR